MILAWNFAKKFAKNGDLQVPETGVELTEWNHCLKLCLKLQLESMSFWPSLPRQIFRLSKLLTTFFHKKRISNFHDKRILIFTNLSTYLIVLRQKTLIEDTQNSMWLIRKFVKILNLFLVKECGEVAQIALLLTFFFSKKKLKRNHLEYAY